MTMFTAQQPMPGKCLSPLPGLLLGWPLEPTDESVGYGRVSLRDKHQLGVASCILEWKRRKRYFAAVSGDVAGTVANSTEVG